MNYADQTNMLQFLRSNINNDEVFHKISSVMTAFVDQGWCDGFDFANENYDRLPVPVSPIRRRIKADGTR